ncbi:MAG: hypothetical protein WBW58_06655, partial [Candidatus Acidiferrum sp.]
MADCERAVENAKCFFNAENEEFAEKRRWKEEPRDAGGVFEKIMDDGSTEMHYCQDTVLTAYHSNVRRG